MWGQRGKTKIDQEVSPGEYNLFHFFCWSVFPHKKKEVEIQGKVLCYCMAQFVIMDFQYPKENPSFGKKNKYIYIYETKPRYVCE